MARIHLALLAALALAWAVMAANLAMLKFIAVTFRVMSQLQIHSVLSLF
jgi:hypothetical protein